MTSTYFEGQANANPLAKRGYSRDHRSDCKQVCIGLVVTRCGLPLGYEVFAGNRHDSTTLQEIVETMESRYGKAQRIWALDRGMVSEDNLDFLKAGQRQYIVGTPKSQLKRFEQQLAAQDWHADPRRAWRSSCARVPTAAKRLTFFVAVAIGARKNKRCTRGSKSGSRRDWRKSPPVAAKRAQQVGGRSSDAWDGCWDKTRGPRACSTSRFRPMRNGAAQVTWKKVEKWRAWAQLSEGSYVLRTNVTRLERRRPVAGVHPIDRSGDGVPHSEERFIATSGVASKGRPRAGPHSGLLPGLRAVEVPGATLPESRVGQRTATRLGRTQRAACGRRRSHRPKRAATSARVA